MTGVRVVLSLIVGGFLLFPAAARPEPAAPSGPESWLKLVLLRERAHNADRKPVVKVEFLEPVDKASVAVRLDDTDVTTNLSPTEKGFDYTAPTELPAGEHKIRVTAKNHRGGSRVGIFSFTTGETRTKLSVAGAVGRALAGRTEKPPASAQEGIRFLSHRTETGAAVKKWGNIWDPRTRMEWGNPSGDGQVSVGDIAVSLSPYTASSLARRGTQWSVRQERTEFSIVSLKGGSPADLLHRRLGTESDGRENLLGTTLKLALPDTKSTVRLAFLTGNDDPSVPGSAGTVPREGNVFDLLVSSEIVEEKLTAELGVAGSRYDSNTRDSLGPRADNAWHAGVKGKLSRLNYDARYEYVGRDFSSIGQSIAADREGLSLSVGTSGGHQALNATYSVFENNVANSGLVPTNRNSLAAVKYTFSGFPKMPIAVGLQHNIVQSTREPTGYTPVDSVVDCVTSQVSFRSGKWSVSPTISRSISEERDQEGPTATTCSLALSLAPSDRCSVTLSPNLTQAYNEATGIESDTYGTNLTVRSDLVKGILSWDVGSSYTTTKISDGTQDSWSFSFDTRLDYTKQKQSAQDCTPKLSLIERISQYRNRVNSTGTMDYSVLLVADFSSLFEH